MQPASCLLKHLNFIVLFQSSTDPVEVKTEGDGMGNPVGELQELTQKKLMKPPIYEFTSEQGPPHAREFVCTVKLGKIQEKGQWIVHGQVKCTREGSFCFWLLLSVTLSQ